MNKKNNFLDRLEDFINDYLPNVKGLSFNTIRSYKNTFRLFIKFLENKHNIKPTNIEFKNLNLEIISEFLKWLEDERKCTPSTRNQRLAALSSFSVYAQSRDFDASSVFRNSIVKVPKKKTVNKKKSYFTKEEIKILLSLPDERYETGLRNKILLSFMYATGARAQEICDLKVKDINFNVSPVSVTILGKGLKRRIISIPSKASNMIYSYLKHKRLLDKPDRHIFSSQTHEQMTISCIEEIYKKYITIAKEKHPKLFPLDNYSPHSMRHTTACHMIEMNIPLIVIKNFLGHSSITTTEVYIEITQSTINKSIEDWNEKWFGTSLKNKTNNSKDSSIAFLN